MSHARIKTSNPLAGFVLHIIRRWITAIYIEGDTKWAEWTAPKKD